MINDVSFIINEAKSHEGELIQVRRFLHTIPEIGDELPRTKRFVCEYLDKIGVPYRTFPDFDGVVAEINGGSCAKTVAFRADMDALHIDEKTDVPFKSEIEGQMHGCGHDAHTAMLLLAAKLMNEHREHFKGKIRFIFQTGEETGTGAKKMIANGAIDGVDALFAIHVGNLAGDLLSAGDFAILPGFVSAGKIKFTITIKGKGTHSAFPEKGIDPIIVAAKILVAFNELMKKEIPEGTPAVLSVGSVYAGEDHNTIPEMATIKGSIRTQDPSVGEFIAKRVIELSESMAQEAGATAILDVRKGSKSVDNDKAMAELAARAVADIVGEEKVHTTLPRPLMASDDFANYAERIPSVYFMLHTNNEKKGIVETNHNPYFDIDEDVLASGVAAYISIASRFLEKENI